MKGGWFRIDECEYCGKPRCLKNKDNPRRNYCYRLGNYFFSSNDCRKILSPVVNSKTVSQPKVLAQDTFDWAKEYNQYDWETRLDK